MLSDGVLLSGWLTYQRFNMLQDQRVCVVQLIHSDVNHKILLGESHVLIHLQEGVTRQLGLQMNDRAPLECHKSHQPRTNY